MNQVNQGSDNKRNQVNQVNQGSDNKGDQENQVNQVNQGSDNKGNQVIEQVKGELVKTQEFKKGLLQQMFV